MHPDRSDAPRGKGPELAHAVSLREDGILGVLARTSHGGDLAFTGASTGKALTRMEEALSVSVSVAHRELATTINQARK